MEQGLQLHEERARHTRRHLAPYGLDEVEIQHDGRKLDAAGALYVSFTEYKGMKTATPVLLWVGNPGDKMSLPAEGRFEDALKREQPELVEGRRWLRP